MSDLNQQPPADRSVKITHLVFGLLFLGVAVVWALVVGDVINENDLAVIAPAVLIAAGVIGLATSLASARNRRNRNEQPYDRRRRARRPTGRRPDRPARRVPARRPHQGDPMTEHQTEQTEPQPGQQTSTAPPPPYQAPYQQPGRNPASRLQATDPHLVGRPHQRRLRWRGALPRGRPDPGARARRDRDGGDLPRRPDRVRRDVGGHAEGVRLNAVRDDLDWSRTATG